MNKAYVNFRFGRQHGLSLIEIMVSMIIGLFLVLGATTLYVSTRQSANVDDSIARLQETARYAMSVIETDVRMANYWGRNKSGSNFSNKINNSNEAGEITGFINSITTATKCGATYAYDVENYLQATNANYALTCPAKTAVIETADTLTVRRAETPVVTKNVSAIQICSNQRELKIIVGAMDCIDASYEIHDLLTHTYYLAQQSDQSTTIPSLRRMALISGPNFADDEILAGVEDMQIQLGWAPPNVGSGTSQPPTSGAVVYLQPDNALINQLGSQIVSVRIWLLVRSEDKDYAFTDKTIYTYGSRTDTSTTTSNLNSAADEADGYAPNDNYHRLLVSKTIFIRNIVGT